MDFFAGLNATLLQETKSVWCGLGHSLLIYTEPKSYAPHPQERAAVMSQVMPEVCVTEAQIVLRLPRSSSPFMLPSSLFHHILLRGSIVRVLHHPRQAIWWTWIFCSFRTGEAFPVNRNRPCTEQLSWDIYERRRADSRTWASNFDSLWTVATPLSQVSWWQIFFRFYWPSLLRRVEA
jgi:hypothetical protein